MLPETLILISFLALVGVLAAWWLRQGVAGAVGPAGKVLVGLAIGLGAAILILLPRAEIVPDGAEPIVAVGAALAIALGFGITWLRLAPR